MNENSPSKHRWNHIDTLVSALESLVWRQRLSRCASGFLRLVATALAVGTILALVAAVIIVPVWVKLTLLALSLSGLSVLLYRWMISPLSDGDSETMAERLEGMYAILKGRLIASVQFASEKHGVPPGTSPELLDLTARQSLQTAASVDISRVVSHRDLRRALTPFGASAFVVAFILFFAPWFYEHALAVYSQPTVEVAPPVGFALSVYPLSSQAVKYRDIEIGGLLTGGQFPTAGTIHYRFSGGSWRSEEMNLSASAGQVRRVADSLRFSYTLREIKRSFEFFVRAGRLRSETVSITAVDRPRISAVAVTINPPSYTGLPPITLNDNSGSFSALEGSRARVSVTSALPIASGEARLSDGSRLPLSFDGLQAHFELAIDSSFSYTINLRDSLGEENPDPIEYQIAATPDNYPTIDLTRPGIDVDLDESLLLPLTIHISDDFGFSSLAIKYKVSTSGREGDENVLLLRFSDDIKVEGDINFSWDLDRLHLAPGDFITYYGEVRDNDARRGPKVSISRVFRARLPGVEELIAEVDKESEDRIEDATKNLNEQRRLSEQMREALRKLQAADRREQTDWRQQKNIEEMVKKSQELSEKLSEMSEEMKKSLERQEGSPTMNQELAEKLREIQELFEQVATPEMREAQRKLAEAMEKMDKEDLEKAMEEFQLSQEELKSRLDRTLELLKRMRVEQKINAMTRAAKELLDRQIASNERTEQSPDEKLPTLAPDEEKIESSLAKLKEQATELEKEIQETELKDMPEAQKFTDALKKSDADQDMKEMANGLRNKQKSSSSEKGASAAKKLKDMLDEMREQQQAMSDEGKEKNNAALRRAIDDANYLSRGQEGMMNDATAVDPRSTTLRSFAAEQQTLRQAVAGFGDRLIKLSSRNPFLSSSLRTLVSDALFNMDQSELNLQNAQGPQAIVDQRDAMVKLNEVSLKLLEDSEKQSQCNKGGSCDKAGQKLESLSEQQQKLNKDTEKQCQKPGGSKPRESAGESNDRQRLQDLAGQQGAIKKSLEELEREFGSRREILGDLGAISREMEKVVEELASGEAGEQTLERQLRIQSRLLESTKALNRRDFTPDRQARVGQDFLRPSPGSLYDGANTSGAYEERLNKYLKEGYPAEYERHVREYFKALNRRAGETIPMSLPLSSPNAPATATPQR